MCLTAGFHKFHYKKALVLPLASIKKTYVYSGFSLSLKWRFIVRYKCQRRSSLSAWSSFAIDYVRNSRSGCK